MCERNIVCCPRVSAAPFPLVIMLPIPKFVRLFYLLSLVSSDNSAPVTGVYNARSVADLWVCQMKINADTRVAEFEFILNNNAGRNLMYPKYFKVDNIDYEFNEVNSTILFLTNPEDPDREIVRDMREYFAPLGELKIPIEAAWTEDGSIVASIIVLDVDLVQNDELDMNAMLSEFQKNLQKGRQTSIFIQTTSPVPNSSVTSTSLEEEVSFSSAPDEKSVRPIVAAAVNSNKSTSTRNGSFSISFILITVLFVSFPLAQGMLEWLIYL